MTINPTYWALRTFRKKFPEEYKRRLQITLSGGARALREYICSEFRYLGKDFSCANCWACEGRYVSGAWEPLIKCRYVPVLRHLRREPCNLFMPRTR